MKQGFSLALIFAAGTGGATVRYYCCGTNPKAVLEAGLEKLRPATAAGVRKKAGGFVEGKVTNFAARDSSFDLIVQPCEILE